MTALEPHDITYANLRDGDRITDPKGVTWRVSDVTADVARGVRLFIITNLEGRGHNMRKPLTDRVTVQRPARPVGTPAQHAVAVLTAAGEALKGTVIAEHTDAEEQAAGAATEEAPAVGDLFENMDQLEMWSHLYLLHGIEAHDVTSRDALIGMHSEAHLGKVRSKSKPHRHVGAVK